MMKPAFYWPICAIALLLSGCLKEGQAKQTWPQNPAGQTHNQATQPAAEGANQNGKRQQPVKKSQYAGQVTFVSDGDTVHVRDTDGQKHKLRLAFIDAPELNQAYGQDSRRGLSERLLRQEVSVQVFYRDQYGREVAKVLHRGQDMNLWQLQQGAVWHYVYHARKEQNQADFAAYAAAAKAARQQRSGLWQNSQAVPPWDFRKQQHGQPGQTP